MPFEIFIRISLVRYSVHALDMRLTEELMTACIEAKSSTQTQGLDSLVLPSPALLWMIPAFCFCRQFLDPLDTQERCVAIQRTRSRQEANFTDHIWDKDLIHDWAGSHDSRLLLLQGNSQTTKRIERFATEIIHSIKSDQPQRPGRLVYVLNTLHPRGNSNHLAPLDLLQQVAVQCLQYARPKGPVGFLVRIFGRFKQAATSKDWFSILQDICVLIPSLYIIIDLAVLGPSHEESQSWPAQFQEMINCFEESRVGCRLKVMLLSCRKFASQVDATLVIKAPPAGSAYPKRHQTRKQLRKIVEDPETTSFKDVTEFESVSVAVNSAPSVSSLAPPRGALSCQAPGTAPGQSSQVDHLLSGFPSLSAPTHRSDFKVAIICALTLESDAVQDVFDERWDEVKYGKMPGDPNQYTTGAIGRHNVVVVHMPGMGKSNGASVAANCRASFSNLGLVLVVGICGGVPFPGSGAEIVLGDIVVSDGLIQYDFGRQFPDKFIRKTDTIAGPNSELLSFLAKMKGRWNMNRLRQRTSMHLKNLSEIVEYPGAFRDKLYEPTYRHKHQTAFNCEICNRCQTKNDPVCGAALKLDCKSLQCDDMNLIARQRLTVLTNEYENQKANIEPSIHFGLYASGDKVMKSGEEREIIAEEEGVIAFEMEGAGVWEGFPGRCLVVKGVCDYADSHKNKIWQIYAAASAAACTKALLESWSL